MNVLLHGAANVIAIGTARIFQRAGHRVIHAGYDPFSRAFFSRFCRIKKILPDPGIDRAAYAEALARLIEEEAIALIVPTSDRDLLDLVASEDFIPDNVALPFPRELAMIRKVMDKGELPAICRVADVLTPQTWSLDAGVVIPPDTVKPLVVKRRRGIAGEGFSRVDDPTLFGEIVERTRRLYPGEELLVQERVDGKVFGAGGIFVNGQIERFSAYEIVARHPAGYGTPTICCFTKGDDLREAMARVLSTVQWSGYCQMDFIVCEKTGEPYLVDINSVHWYTMPFSADPGLNTLFYYLGAQERPANRPYTTLCLSRELQRRLGGGAGKGWPKYLHRSDFYWDPAPIVFAPLLRRLRQRRHSGMEVD